MIGIYLDLFLSFVQIGLFSIGGGYAALPLIQQQVVDIHGWLTMGQFTDLITIAEMTPGPIAINASTFVGTQIGGLPGALIATIGCVTPSTIIVISLAYFYYKYNSLQVVKRILETLRPVVVALIATAGASIIIVAFWGGKTIGSLKDINLIALGIFAFCFIVLKKFKASPVAIIVISGAIGSVVYGGLF